jgi:predicted outer membrane repeat protein
MNCVAVPGTPGSLAPHSFSDLDPEGPPVARKLVPWSRRVKPSALQRCQSVPCRLRVECLEERAVPATYTVSLRADVVDAGDAKLSLREAITRANTHAGADTIVLPTGVCPIAIAGPGENGNATGDFDITDTVTIQGKGAGVSVIDGQQIDRVIHAFGTAPGAIRVVLQGLTVRGGSVTGEGGGVLVGNADLVIRDSVVSWNRSSGAGGGVSNNAAPGTGDVSIIRSTVSYNAAGTFGGGVQVSGVGSALTVTSSTVNRNVATGNGGGIGANTVTLKSSTVSGNSAGGGGGGIAAFTLAALTNCRVIGNSAGAEGGGISTATATVTTSTVSGNSAVADGGGIAATILATVANSTVRGNHSAYGGGINAGTATVTSSTVSENSAGLGGGGINAGTATISNSTVSENSASDTNAVGGGIRVNTATISNSTVSDNSAGRFGGGIKAGTMTMTSSTVSGNFAGYEGGGIWNSGDVTVTACTLSGNFATHNGGGIEVLGTATLTNCTISGNTAGDSGGGISATGTVTLVNATVVENLAHSWGGGVNRGPGGSFSIRNSIIATNLVDFTGSHPDISGVILASAGHNLIGVGAGSDFVNGVNGDIVGTSANPIDPNLGALKNNGGRTMTHALRAGSPAIDHGDNVSVPANDQRGTGFARRKDGDGNGTSVVDIGAFER